MFERIVIAGNLHRQYLLHDAQHGFLSGRLGLTNLFIALNTVIYLMDDVEDVVNHRFICAKLVALGVSSMMVCGITIYLAYRTF